MDAKQVSSLLSKFKAGKSAEIDDLKPSKLVAPMKPVLSYYGGKQRLASKIIPYIPKHTVYCEPFCGGATILFKKPWPKVKNKDHYREVINDTSEDLVNFYRVMQTRFDELKHMIGNTLFSESELKRSLKILNEKSKDNLLLRAWAYYVASQQSFNAQVGRGWRRHVFGVNLGAKHDFKIQNFYKYRNRLMSVSVSCTDAITCIKQWDSPQTFFYCDPPYPGAFQGHYKGYTQNDFDLLIKTLSNCNGSAIVSCYNQDINDENWMKINLDAICSASNVGKIKNSKLKKANKKELGNRERIEVLLIKKAIKPRIEIQKLYDSGKFDCFTGDKIWENEIAKERMEL